MRCWDLNIHWMTYNNRRPSREWFCGGAGSKVATLGRGRPAGRQITFPHAALMCALIHRASFSQPLAWFMLFAGTKRQRSAVGAAYNSGYQSDLQDKTSCYVIMTSILNFLIHPFCYSLVSSIVLPFFNILIYLFFNLISLPLYFLIVRWDFGYCGHYCPIVPAPDDRRWWLWRNWWNEDWQGKPKYWEKKPAPAPLCPPQIPHD
jgi:hypothetical protein